MDDKTRKIWDEIGEMLGSVRPVRHKSDIEQVQDDFWRCDEAVEFLVACGFTQREVMGLNMDLFSRHER
jgi:hypothetical protein